MLVNVDSEKLTKQGKCLKVFKNIKWNLKQLFFVIIIHVFISLKIHNCRVE